MIYLRWLAALFAVIGWSVLAMVMVTVVSMIDRPLAWLAIAIVAWLVITS